jgi:phosphatidylinositol-bisphosphatase
LQEKAAGNVFAEFEEGKIKFPPTYKFKVGTSDYDSRTDKIRIPSWCDRILFRGKGMTQVFYSSVGSPTISDHKPVVSLLKMKYKKCDPLKQKIVTLSILDYLNNLKESFIPKMKLATNKVVFNGVCYKDTKQMEFEIENVGDGLLEFEINKVEDS